MDLWSRLGSTYGGMLFTMGVTRRMASPPRNAGGCALMMWMLLATAGCDSRDVQPTADGTKVGRPEPIVSTEAVGRCDIGGRPDYFVPGGNDGPFAIVGCARLGVSGKPVEFSADYERIAQQDAVCLDPAFRGRGQMGIYIPATCPADSMLSRFRILDAQVPSQAVRDYEFVIWGTAKPATRGVVATFEGGRASGAVFNVGQALAIRVGASRPFSVFIVELPIAARCASAKLRARSPSGTARKRLAPARGLACTE